MLYLAEALEREIITDELGARSHWVRWVMFAGVIAVKFYVCDLPREEINGRELYMLLYVYVYLKSWFFPDEIRIAIGDTLVAATAKRKT